MTKHIIVIGGGLGGISAAIRMAQSGYSVSLYEQNNHIGGKVNRHESDGFGFDLGPSILTMPYIFEKLFEYSKKQMSDYVTIKRLHINGVAFFQMERLSICMKVLKKQVSIMRYCRNRI
ncbi:4,4'-diaponeurosporene oxidase [Staphylococcus aureus T36127]|nr:4,4'-diaponeurosporene oxidase [Staphylococcus aureus T51001]EWK94628.1 4,4'-diaponeurosporene oxidase [Staphylococcus aureus H75143]EWU22034.1 4,4'-diaponeurosporene oxidase [Staphylococcus aureus T36127]EWX85976.1 4,4'-diaponeurosporene oxidase [Staphylococcus aureus M70006]EYJ75656.1 4,4'-diaponeurosporene oxidase [Staphylococcus aureus H43687]